MPRKAMSETPEPAEPAFAPFADDASVESFGDLSIENGTGRIALHGSLDLTRDRAGLERARRLRAIIDRIVVTLEETEDLPEKVAEANVAPRRVKNPFA